MNTHCKKLILAIGLAAAFTGVAYADGDGGDNSMSQWTGDSYAAFNGGNIGTIGDFYTHREKVARRGYPAAEPGREPAVETLASAKKGRHIMSPFRDDTAA